MVENGHGRVDGPRLFDRRRPGCGGAGADVPGDAGRAVAMISELEALSTEADKIGVDGGDLVQENVVRGGWMA